MQTTNTNTPRTTTMTALVQTGFGDPSEVLRVGEVERPEPADDSVLVRVRAASVHVGTVYGVRGFPKLMRPMFKTFIADDRSSDMPTRIMPMTTPTTTRPAPPAVEVRDLSKVYDSRAVVDDVSFTVEQGEIFAILGPNAAGKSTTVESIAGLRTPDAGTVRVFGNDPLADRIRVRRLLGVQLQDSSFPDKLTVREIVDTYRGLYPNPLDSDELLERLGLGSSAATRYAKLSGGQQQRVSIAVALVGRPRAVILDELTTGLDPQSRRDAWTLVGELRDSGVTVLLATHFMEEAERLADRLALIDRGRVVALDTPDGLVDGTGLEQQLRFSTTAALNEDWIRRLPEVSGIARDRGEFVVTGDERMLFSVVSLLAAHDIVPGRLQVDQPTLDDAFVALTGRTLHADDALEAPRPP